MEVGICVLGTESDSERMRGLRARKDRCQHSSIMDEGW